MKKNEKDVLERNLEQKAFEDVAKAIKGGKENGGLTNVELVENLVKDYKGKTVQAPIEVIITSVIFLDTKELIGIIEVLKDIVQTKIMEELKDRADKDESTGEDALLALMIATSEMSKRNKQS